MKKLLIIFLFLFPLSACRNAVLEDRTQCPSYLYFDLLDASRFEDYESVYVTAFRHPDGQRIEGITTTKQAIANKNFFILCRNSDAVRGYGIMGQRQCYNAQGTEWVTPVGNQFDSLFRFSYVVQVQPESFSVPVEFVKESCKVSVQFKGLEALASAEGIFPFDLLIRSNSCGIDVMSGTPVRGSFEYRPPELTIGRFEFFLPRQADRNLRMELYGRKGAFPQEGFYQSLDLWRILHELGGISWNEKNLPDVLLEIDYVQSLISVKITPWSDNEIQYEF